MKQAPKKLLASLLAIALVLSCVIIPQTIITTNAAEGDATTMPTFVADSFLGTIGAQKGDVIADIDYTVDGATTAGWTGVSPSNAQSIHTFIPVDASTGEAAEVATQALNINSGGEGYCAYNIPAKNFIIKLDAYSTYNNSGETTPQFLNSNGDVLTQIAYPSCKRTIESSESFWDAAGTNKVLINGNKVKLSTSYDLDVLNTTVYTEIVVYEGYAYYFDKDGVRIFAAPLMNTATDSTVLKVKTWGSGISITNFEIVELETSFANYYEALGATATNNLMHRDYSAHTTFPTDDFSASLRSGNMTSGTDSNGKAYSGVLIENTNWQADSGLSWVNIPFSAADYAIRVSYTHIAFGGGFSFVQIHDSAATNEALIRLPYYNRTDTNNHHGLLAQNNEINVLSNSTGGIQKGTVSTDLWDFRDEESGSAVKISVTLYIISIGEVVYYYAEDGSLLHKNVAFGDATENRNLQISSNSGGICLTGLDIISLAQTLDTDPVDDLYADKISATVGDTILDKDYTAYGHTTDGWTGSGNITVATNSNRGTTAAGIAPAVLNNSSSYGTTYNASYALPDSLENFVVKFKVRFNSTADNMYLAVGTTDSAGNTLTKMQIPGANRANEAAANTASSMTGGFTMPTDLYDLDVDDDRVMYLFCMAGMAYWVAPNGTMFRSEAIADATGRNIYFSNNWGNAVNLLSVSVRELKSIYSGGKGTEEDPYMIETADQLYRAVGSFGGSKYYKLANDIYLNDIDAIDWTTGAIIKDGYEPVEWFKNTASGTSYIGSDGTTASSFTGTIDGDGYTVHGIWYDSVDRSIASGLLPAVGTATVKNLSIANSYIMTNGYVAGICGNLRGSLTVDGFVLEDTVTLRSGWASSAGGGGIVGQISNGARLTVKDTAIYADIDAYGTLDAGILANVWSGATLNITNAISVGYPVAFVNDGNKSDLNYATTNYTFANLYSDTACDYTLIKGEESYTGLEEAVTELATTDIKGQAALATMDPIFAEGTVWYASTTDKYPQLLAWGAAHNDIDKSGAVDTGDLFALRTTILGTAAITYEWTNVNGDAVDADVADLVALKLKKKN